MPFGLKILSPSIFSFSFQRFTIFHFWSHSTRSRLMKFCTQLLYTILKVEFFNVFHDSNFFSFFRFFENFKLLHGLRHMSLYILFTNFKPLSMVVASWNFVHNFFIQFFRWGLSPFFVNRICSFLFKLVTFTWNYVSPYILFNNFKPLSMVVLLKCILMRISRSAVGRNYPRGGGKGAEFFLGFIYSLTPRKPILSSNLGHFRPKFVLRGGTHFLFFTIFFR